MVGLGLLAAPLANAQEAMQLEQVGRPFLEAEAQSWIAKWLDQHPPVEGVQGFGGKTMFVVQLLFAADAFTHAETDQQRFHAAAQGATAYIAYAYAATPAVGIIVTAVVLAAQIVESGVAGGYVETMLALQKEMLATQARIADLQFRAGLARANRLLVLVDATQDLALSSAELDQQLSLDCSERAGDFATLGGCLELLTQVVAARQALIAAIGRLLSLPNEDLALLGTAETAEAMPDPATRGAKAREQLTAQLTTAQDQTDELVKVYEGFEKTFRELATAYLIDEALSKESRLAAVAAVRHRCLVDHTKLALAASAVTIELVSVGLDLKQKPEDAGVREAAKMVGAKADGLRDSYRQRSVSCPIIHDDATLAEQIRILTDRLALLPPP